MSSIAPILITVPRYVTIPRIRPCPTPATIAAGGATEVATSSKPSTFVVQQHSQSQSSSAMSSSGEDDPVAEFLVVRSGKKRRLDHLSWEEKFQRK